ncbi:MAG: hypothetical protein HY902_02335 [Deltaproteobacteria bacterium]|nr:hypothetical protein [Deltaproteobacteria bacterium]
MASGPRHWASAPKLLLSHGWVARCWLLALALTVAACGSDPCDPAAVVGKAEVQPSPGVPCPVDPTLRTARCMDSEAAILAWASGAKGAWPASKFVIGRFFQASGPAWFMDPAFYAMHDEWYWFRLLNGYAVDGDCAVPKTGLSFASLSAAYAWAKQQKTLPYDLAFYDTRLYSPHFYDLAGICWQAKCPPRTLGVGTLFHLPADPKRPYPHALWAFDLVYLDTADKAILQHYFNRLQKMLPAQVFAQLHWVAATSTQQIALAKALRAEGGPLAERVLTWPDLVSPGAVEDYTLGLTAGRVRKLGVGQAESAGLAPTDLAILPDVPLSLPPVAGILTAVPQTPQAHLNLLAAARGTHNAFVAGILDDKVLDLWSKEGARVVLEVKPDRVRYRQMEDGQWKTWLEFNQPPVVALAMANLEGAPFFLPLTGGSVALSRAWLPLIGGKAMGLMALASLPGVDTPPQVAVITVAGYAKHLEPLRPLILGMLDDADFKANKLARALFLEGPTAYAGKYASDPLALEFWRNWTRDPKSAAAQKLVAAGGLQTLIRQQPFDPAWWNGVEADLKQRFARLSHQQALRFRSSSTAEDIDGFNGAGVYTSTSGFLYPAEQAKKSDQALSAQKAVAGVYASYWGSQAVEERILAGIDHLEGRMAVAVHPRFDNEVESANGVALLAVLRGPQGDRFELTLNAQPGAISVTNPPEGVKAQPEIDRITQVGNGAPQLVRLQLAATETTGPDGLVLSDKELLDMFAQVAPLAAQWIDAKNAPLAAEERSSSVQLDFEFRRVAAGWPMLADGTALRPRLVWKQVRSLEHVGGVGADKLAGALVPRDVLHAATKAVRVTCKTPAFTATLTELYTRANGPTAVGVPLTDYAVKPFTARMQLQIHQFVGGLMPGMGFDASHIAVQFSHPATTAKHWDVRADVSAAMAKKWSWKNLTVDEGGGWSIAAGVSQLQGKGAICTEFVLASGKETFLSDILGAN